MSVSFFEKTCSNSDHCDCSIACLENITAEKFGISDFLGGSGKPAKVLFSSPEEWDLTVNNPSKIDISFKAVDWCINIFRTGSYDLKDEKRDVNHFSSSSIGSDLIKRCEGFLYYNSKIQFIEIKRKRRNPSEWVKDAREKFEETILSFREHHPIQANLISKPILINKVKNSFLNFSDIEQQKILKDKVGLNFVRTASIEV